MQPAPPVWPCRLLASIAVQESSLVATGLSTGTCTKALGVLTDLSLVPELLCSTSGFQHAGTTDIDVQVDLEIACGSVHTARLEQALRNAEFEPDSRRVWRWRADGPDSRTVVKFELLADLDEVAAGAEVHFNGCESLGAANLRGTGFAASCSCTTMRAARRRRLTRW